jgi:uncharacterized protein YndB with AHSA1/START domain/uncharacterized damage-inducible protein DinB
VRVERTFAAPPSLVYRAWLDPRLLARWLAPGDLEVSHVDVEERVGGRYRIWQSLRGEQRGGCEGEILELVPNERIALRWGWAGPDHDAGPVYDSLLTITLRPTADGGTALTLVHERLDAIAGAKPDIGRQVDRGWTITLDKLPRALAAQSVREFDDLPGEFATTRRLLERFPAEHAQWRPHPRSSSLATLATHLAWLPAFAELVLGAPQVEAAAVPVPPEPASTTQAVLALHDAQVASALHALATADAAQLDEPWTLRHGDHVLRTGRRGRMLRELLVSHAAHHRGQLTVYYRLLGVPVPTAYGPTADES